MPWCICDSTYGGDGGIVGVGVSLLCHGDFMLTWRAPSKTHTSHHRLKSHPQHLFKSHLLRIVWNSSFEITPTIFFQITPSEDRMKVQITPTSIVSNHTFMIWSDLTPPKFYQVQITPTSISHHNPPHSHNHVALTIMGKRKQLRQKAKAVHINSSKVNKKNWHTHTKVVHQSMVATLLLKCLLIILVHATFPHQTN